MIEPILDLDGWVSFFKSTEIPMLKRTARELGRVDLDADELNIRGISDIISADPLMTVALLRYLQHYKHSVQQFEVVQVEQALMMLGMKTVFEKVRLGVVAEDLLQSKVIALTGMLHVVRRATRAAHYARDWAVRLQDTHFDEIHIAALLHNFAEILMWCYAPQQMMQVREMQLKDKTLRSRVAQYAVFGFKLSDLQLALAKSWMLPSMLIGSMEKTNTHQRQMHNIFLAVNLARHAENGWDDAALPDDYKAIGELLHISAIDVQAIVQVT
jgi:HD-like signal output (HDOD) protein